MEAIRLRTDEGAKNKAKKPAILENLYRFKDDKLMEFITSTMLDKKHAVYKDMKIPNVNDHPDILLPALELPIFPEAYKEEVQKFIGRITARKDGSSIRNVRHFADSHYKSSENKAEIDGIPYNPQDFHFPISPKEKEKLGQLAELLHNPQDSMSKKLSTKRLLTINLPMNANKLKRSKSVQFKPKNGKLIRERLKVINENLKYKNELEDKINDKLGKVDSYPNNPSEKGDGKIGKERFSSSGKFASHRGRKLIPNDDHNYKLKMKELLIRKKEVAKYGNNRIEKDWEEMISTKTLTREGLISESDQYHRLLSEWSGNTLLSKRNSETGSLNKHKNLKIDLCKDKRNIEKIISQIKNKRSLESSPKGESKAK